MRSLTKKQEAALRDWYKKNYDGNSKFDMADKIDYDTYNRIYEMHPTEIHYDNVNRFLEKMVDGGTKSDAQKQF